MLNGNLPSIKALRTFIAVANNMSFSKAANELCVTQGAVSKNIASLEQQLGQPLFNRHLNGIELSNTGEQYLPKISEALEIIQYATENLTQTDHAEEVLTINVPPSFASLWLIPQLEKFYHVNKNIRIRIKTGDGMIKRTHGDSDITIRCLPISKHYENATLLRQENLLLISSFKQLKDTPIAKIQNIANHQFIPHITRPHLWEQFKKVNKLNYISQYSCTGFEHFYMSLEAVKDNLGLALLPDFMAENSLKDNVVCNPLNISMTTSYGYYLFVPSYRLSSRKIYEFSHWIGQLLGKENL